MPHHGRLATNIDAMCTGLGIKSERSKGVTANYLCDRLAQAYLRLSASIKPSTRPGLRTRVQTEHGVRAATAVPDIKFSSELFLKDRDQRVDEQNEAVSSPSTPSV